MKKFLRIFIAIFASMLINNGFALAQEIEQEVEYYDSSVPIAAIPDATPPTNEVTPTPALEPPYTPITVEPGRPIDPFGTVDAFADIHTQLILSITRGIILASLVCKNYHQTNQSAFTKPFSSCVEAALACNQTLNSNGSQAGLVGSYDITTIGNTGFIKCCCY